MAIDPSDQARAFLQAVGMVNETRTRLVAAGRPDDNIVVGNLARRLLAQNTNVPGANFAAYQAVARRAITNEVHVYNMNADATIVVGRSALPVVPTLYGDPERYRYRVIVHASDAAGRSVSYPGEVRSDTPLSRAEIEARVGQSLDFRVSDRPATRQAVASLGPGSGVDAVTLLSASRTY